jgi:hypothetical protein
MNLAASAATSRGIPVAGRLAQKLLRATASHASMSMEKEAVSGYLKVYAMPFNFINKSNCLLFSL